MHLAMKEVRDATARVLDGTSLASLRRQVGRAHPPASPLTPSGTLDESRTGTSIAYLLYQLDRVYRLMTMHSLSGRTPAPALTTRSRCPGAPQELRQALQAIRYGAIELVIHDGRVVQLERREKVRFEHEVTEQQR